LQIESWMKLDEWGVKNAARHSKRQ